jgi:hypothetical protein
MEVALGQRGLSFYCDKTAFVLSLPAENGCICVTANSEQTNFNFHHVRNEVNSKLVCIDLKPNQTVQTCD